MTTPDVPLRMELTFEVPGTPEQVWDAIATAEGISAWFLRTDLEAREGGAICTHMGEDLSSPGTVTGYEPPRRFAYEEPEWASLMGQADAAVTPLATEFLVEAQSGGTCVVRVVSSAFGTGADWESEFFADMERYWAPYFDQLRLYLTHFPGQRVSAMDVGTDIPGSPETVLQAVRSALGAEDTGQTVEACGFKGEVERMSEIHVLVRATDPVPGLLAFFVMRKEEGLATAQVQGWLFSDDAAEVIEQTRPAWKAWLDDLAVPAR